jgi:AraC-like DNA-binding protein
MPDVPHCVIVGSNRLPMRILRFARAPLWPWWYLTRSRPSGLLFYTNDISGASITFSGRTLPLRGGRTVAIPAHCEFSTVPGPDTHQVYAEVDIPGLPHGLPTHPVELPPDPLLGGFSSELHRRMPLRSTARDPALLMLASAWLHLAVARLCEQLSEPDRKQWETPAGDELQPALEHLEMNLGSEHYMPELAGRCGMGPQWFTKKFRARYGRSPAQYLIDRRVTVAAQRLVHEETSIEDIAAATGFTDRAHFSKVFAQRLGLPPARYREEERRRFRSE